MAEPTRLNKQLAYWLGVSRREADDLIASGRILVNGDPAKLGQRVVEEDYVVFDQKPVKKQIIKRLIALNKPVGYTCSRAKQRDEMNVYDLLPKDMTNLKLVGRLDKDSSGIILLTNDGDFAYKMTHPKFQKTKIYLVVLDHTLEPLHQQMISDFGIDLPDGRSRLQVSKISPEEIADLGIDYAKPKNNQQIYRVEMSEGRNRQIRRTFEALGYAVTDLHRINFGEYFVSDLNLKQWREEQF